MSRIRKDYMVTTDTTSYEVICASLTEARKTAKQLSKEHGDAHIQKWVYEYGDMVIDENFSIYYEDGKEVK